MSRHPEDKCRFNEATRKLKEKIKIGKEKYFRRTLRA
jgi:hypothetical protein